MGKGKACCCILAVIIAFVVIAILIVILFVACVIPGGHCLSTSAIDGTTIVETLVTVSTNENIVIADDYYYIRKTEGDSPTQAFTYTFTYQNGDVKTFTWTDTDVRRLYMIDDIRVVYSDEAVADQYFLVKMWDDSGDAEGTLTLGAGESIR